MRMRVAILITLASSAGCMGGEPEDGHEAYGFALALSSERHPNPNCPPPTRRQGAVCVLEADAVLTETLELVAESGVNWSGVLCGRATWKDGVPVYAKGGLKALEDWLADQGVKNIQSVNQRLKAAKPWYSFYGVESAAALR